MCSRRGFRPARAESPETGRPICFLFYIKRLFTDLLLKYQICNVSRFPVDSSVSQMVCFPSRPDTVLESHTVMGWFALSSFPCSGNWDSCRKLPTAWIPWCHGTPLSPAVLVNWTLDLRLDQIQVQGFICSFVSSFVFYKTSS